MARPTKQGIDYFPLDCQFDDKVEMYLIEKGATGLAILVTIWQMIYSNEGYYIIDNKDLHLLVKRKIDVEINEVSDCINVCLSRQIFDKCSHKKHQILTSKAIQKRFLEITRKRSEVKINDKYLLIDVDSRKNIVIDTGNEVIGIENTTKKSKGKERKEKNNVNEIFDHWKSTLKHQNARLDDRRKKIIQQALKNYSLDELKLAILGCSKTPHNMGDNEKKMVYDGLHIIFRDSDNIERFIRNSRNTPLRVVSSGSQKKLQA